MKKKPTRRKHPRNGNLRLGESMKMKKNDAHMTKQVAISGKKLQLDSEPGMF